MSIRRDLGGGERSGRFQFESSSESLETQRAWRSCCMPCAVYRRCPIAWAVLAFLPCFPPGAEERWFASWLGFFPAAALAGSGFPKVSPRFPRSFEHSLLSLDRTLGSSLVPDRPYSCGLLAQAVWTVLNAAVSGCDRTPNGFHSARADALLSQCVAPLSSVGHRQSLSRSEPRPRVWTIYLSSTEVPQCHSESYPACSASFS